MRLLPLDRYVAGLRHAYGPTYTTVVVPDAVYGLAAPVPTIGVGNYLVTRPDLPEDVARAVLRVLFDRWDELSRAVTAGARLEPRFAISTGSVPLHPGAVAYYRSVYG